jgi:hypothetical protein
MSVPQCRRDRWRDLTINFHHQHVSADGLHSEESSRSDAPLIDRVPGVLESQRNALWEAQVDHAVADGVIGAAVGAAHATFGDPPVIDAIGEENQAVGRTAARAGEEVGEEEVQGRDS